MANLNLNAVAVAVALVSQLMLLSACNTTAGAGKDIKSVGSTIQRSADDAK